MKTFFVVLSNGTKGKKFALAVSKSQSKAIGYAYMCKQETYVRKCSNVEVSKYMGSFYVLNLD